MRTRSKRLALASMFLLWAQVSRAQTADEVIEKCLTALGGRAAFAKLTSQSATGTIVLSTPGGEVSGSIEILNAAPNKSRTLIKADLSALGAGQLVMDQRFDGTSGYVLDSLQGNHDITGNQLDNMRNGAFPNGLLTYKKLGATARLGAKEKVGGRDAYPVDFDFPSGSVVHQFIDAETYLPIKVVVKVDVPQLGREMEQTSELLDYRQVDGVKMPFEIRSTSSVQNFTITFEHVEHNTAIDQTLFSKPVK
jgi:outer membrane lipoprotein-sorting protein